MRRRKFDRIPYRSGIYLITSNAKDRRYVGSAVDLNNRIRGHRNGLKRNKHNNKYMQRHVTKYGIDDLKFTILEFCNKDQLIEREQHYIDLLSPEFNLCPIAGSSLGRKFSEETKKKFRGKNNPMYGKGRKGKDNPNFGKTWEEIFGMERSVELKNNMSNIHKGNTYNSGKKHSRHFCENISKRVSGENNPFFGKKHTEETKQKISKIRTGTTASLATKEKMSKTHNGKRHTEETRKKISNNRKGKGPKHLSENHKEKIRLAGIGRTQSEETKQKISQALKRSWQNRKTRCPLKDPS